MANAKNITKVIVGEDLYYLKDKQVRDSIGAANGIATLDSEGKISSSLMPAGIGDVTGVKGDSESSYRTGNVNITKGNIGLGNVGNFKAVSTAASQGLTDTEKSNARTNIGAGTGNGTVTGIKMNGASKGTSGVVDLGTVITAHQDISGKADKATTLAGYGITDAKIASGVITLGSNTITPLTSHQDISGKADKSATVSNVAWGSNKLTKTINGTTSDVVTASTIKTALSLAKGDVGLGNVTNDAQVKRSEMGVASGVATLGTDGKVPSSQLPSYVDDVLEYTNKASFPTTGETGKIYVDKATDTTWRWSGSAYTQIKGDLVIGTATGNAADGKVVNDHIGNTSNPHSVTKAQVGLGNVENKSSATIRSEITSSNVTTALGYTPYNSTNPNGYTSNTGTVTGVKVGSSGSTIGPSSGVVTIPAYETGAQKHIAPTAAEVKSALGTGSGTSKYLREDGTWQTPPDHTYTVNNGTFSLKQKAGSTTTTVADFTANQSGTDDITFIQGSNITLTPDTTNRTITIASTDTNTWRPLGTGASDACAGNDSRLSNSRPASDVYSWAKASTKPTYTASEVGLGNVGNFKAVSTVASQGLSDTEKSNARANIGAGTSSFSGSYNDLSNKPTIPAAANNGIFSVKTKVGSNSAVTAADFTANQSSADDVTFIQGSNVTLTTDTTNRTITIASTDTNTWRPVSDSVSSTSSSDAASSKAVKTAYDLAASKTSNIGTITKVGNTSSGNVAVSSSNNTASWNSAITVGSVGGVDLKFTMPSNPNTDTKNTTGSTAKQSTKLFLVGAESQGANPQTYSNTNCFIGIDNNLYTNGLKVAKERDAFVDGMADAVTSITSVPADKSGSITINKNGTTWTGAVFALHNGTSSNSGVGFYCEPGQRNIPKLLTNVDSTPTNWYDHGRIITTDNIGSLSCNYATSAGTASNANALNGKTTSGLMWVEAQAAKNANSCYDASLNMCSGGSSNLPSGSQYGSLLVLPYRLSHNNGNPNFATLLFMPNGDDSVYPNEMFFRTSVENSWNAWQRVQSVSMSDEQLKTIIGHPKMTIEQIANAPMIRFLWNKEGYGDNREHVGSIAQYWEKVLPEAVEKEPGGYLSMQYGQIALLSAINIAKEIVADKEKIKTLEEENSNLRLELEDIKARLNKIEEALNTK